MPRSATTGLSSPTLARVDRLVRARLTRVLLSALIVLSLLPFGASEPFVRTLCAIVFGGELLLRFILWRARGRPEGFGTVAFAVVDVVAFFTFLPLEWVFGPGSAGALALLRLVRLLALLRFLRTVAMDFYAIVTRREAIQQFVLVTAVVTFLSFVAAVILSQLSIPHDDVGAPGFIDRLWWSFRQLESADNLVPTVRNRNVVLVLLSLSLTVTGVFVISFLIGIGTSLVEQLVIAERRRALTYRGHTLMVGPVQERELLVREFVRIYAKNRQIPRPEEFWTWVRHSNPLAPARQFPRVALLSHDDDAPDFLYEPLMRWVVHRQGDAAEPRALERVAAQDAKRALLLARQDLLHETDAVTVAALAAFRAVNDRAHVFVEVTDSATVPIVERVGGAFTQALDVPRFMGMFLCQHLITPGVEALYRDLLTVDGAEIYTHVFVDDDERAALARAAQGGTHISFAALAELAHRRHGVHIIGVLLSDGAVLRTPEGLVPPDRLVPWVNPHVVDASDAAVVGLGAEPGRIPLRSWAGLIGICDSYLALRAFAPLALTASPAPTTTPSPPVRAGVAEAIERPTSPGPRKVALIGFSQALPSLLHELAHYVPGLDVVLFVSARGDDPVPLMRRLDTLRVGVDSDGPVPGAHGKTYALERGGSVTIYSHDGPDLPGFAARTLAQLAAVEAVVFLSEPVGDERDARTGLRILRFARLLEEGKIPRGPQMHILAEFTSVDKGAHIQAQVRAHRCGFAGADDLRLTLVSTDTIQNYFMVHSAFVPGVAHVYEQLLEESGQEIVRYRFHAPANVMHVTMDELRRALQARGAVAFAVEKKDRTVLIAPEPDEPLVAADVAGVYAIANNPFTS